MLLPQDSGEELGPKPGRNVPLPDPADAEAAIRPTAITPIPDNPPPHEGNWFALPYRVEPPDLIVVDVLDALPGRQIQGDRLVRSDGTISLGMYGDIHVADLSCVQIKEKITHHLRIYLTDSQMGLTKFDEDKYLYVDVDPKDSNHIYVDVSAYNSKIYYVQGWVGIPGRLPITGRDTILDALNYSGGILQGAITDEVHLFRPARGDQPTRDYKIDLEAIYKGIAKANLQMFPGDRLVIPGPPGNKNAILSGPNPRRNPPDFPKAPRHDEPVPKGRG